jgi:thiol-disulfide isomerase/thioredoxin
MEKTEIKLGLGYALAIAMVFAFFTLASYGNTFSNQYYNFALKLLSSAACGFLLKKFFTGGQVLVSVLLFIGLLLFVFWPYNAYRININIPAYSFCCLGFAAGYYFKQLKPVIAVPFLLVCSGWAWLNAAHIYPNFMLGRINEYKANINTDAEVAGIFSNIKLQKGDSAVILPAGDGKVYLVDFFFNNCPPCRAKEPYVQQIAKEISNPSFEVLYIESGKYDQYATYRRNYERLGGKVLYDMQNTLSDSLGINSYPFELIIDKKGKVRYISEGFAANKQTGELYVTQTKEKIQKLLNE